MLPERTEALLPGHADSASASTPTGPCQASHDTDGNRRNGQHPEFHPGAFRRGLRHADLTDGEFRVAVELAEFANVGDPVVWPGANTLAEICGMTKDGVKAVLKRLKAKGVIVLADSASNKGGRGHSNRWRLLVIPAPERVIDGTPFTDSQRGIDGTPFEPERGIEETAKGVSTDRERGIDGTPEVVRSSEREVGGAGDPLDGPAPEWLKPPNGIDPPKRTCPLHPHSEACSTCGADKDARTAWAEHGRRELAALRREMDDVEREQRSTEDNDRYMELDRQWKLLRHQSKCWAGVLRAERVPGV